MRNDGNPKPGYANAASGTTFKTGMCKAFFDTGYCRIIGSCLEQCMSQQERWLRSTEARQILKVSTCELSHLRQAGIYGLATEWQYTSVVLYGFVRFVLVPKSGGRVARVGGAPGAPRKSCSWRSWAAPGAFLGPRCPAMLPVLGPCWGGSPLHQAHPIREQSGFDHLGGWSSNFPPREKPLAQKSRPTPKYF